MASEEQWVLTFTRYGGEEVITFHCREDAEMVLHWFRERSASIDERLHVETPPDTSWVTFAKP